MRSCAALFAPLVLVLVSACGDAPGRPSASFSAPRPTGPVNDESYRFSDQPITLTFENAIRTAPATTTYAVEVATDSGFSVVVWSRTDIAEASGPTTSVVIGPLGGNTTYYWRLRAAVDGVAGRPSSTRSFRVRAPIVLNAPSTRSPAPGDSVAAEQPPLTIANSTRSGPVGGVFYEFQVSTTAAFSPIVASATVAEQSPTTTWSPPGLSAGTYYWRARAADPSNSETSGFSAAASFVLTPFSLRLATITNSPPGIVDWPETTRITLVELRGGGEDVSGIRVEFSKKEGPGRWPDVVPPGWRGPLQYCLGMVLRINGRYYADAPVQMWHGRERGGGPPSLFGRNWFYDPARWGPMAGYQPATGETIGIFVAAGVTRDRGHGTGDLSPVKERSNVVFVPMPTDAGATFRFE